LKAIKAITELPMFKNTVVICWENVEGYCRDYSNKKQS